MTDLNVYSRGLARLCFDAYELYRDGGRTVEAEQFLKRAITYDPENTLFLERLVILYSAKGRAPDALAWCQRIAEIDPANVTCQLNIGLLSARLGRLGDAEKAFRRVVELAPEHYGGYQELVRLYLQMGTNLHQARDLAEKAVALEPSALNHFLLGLACLANKDSAAALPTLKRATELEPQNARYTRAYLDTQRRMRSK